MKARRADTYPHGRELLERRAELRSAMERGYLPAWALRAGLVPFLDRAFTAWAGRAAGTARRNAEAAATVRAGILKAAGALTSVRGAAGAVQRRIARRGPAEFGLKRVPDVRTIRDVIERKEDVPEPACTHGDADAG